MTKEYTFTAELPGLSDGQSYSATKYGADGTATDPVTLSSGSKTFTLKNGERIVIENIPQAQQISVSETGADIGSETGNDGKYKVETSLSDESAIDELSGIGSTVSFKLKSDVTVTFTNTLSDVPKSGITPVNTIGVVFMILLVIFGWIMMTLYRIHRRIKIRH